MENNTEAFMNMLNMLMDLMMFAVPFAIILMVIIAFMRLGWKLFWVMGLISFAIWASQFFG